jgi:purine-nucleoside phosphorylase
VLVEHATVLDRVPYSELGLPSPSVEGHAGELVLAELEGVRVVLLSGRIHAYEGAPMDQVVAHVRAMAAWGVKRVVLTNAAGAVRPGLMPGSILLMRDHLNLMGRSPLVGPCPAGQTRFPDMSTAYDPQLCADAVALAETIGMPLEQGIYAAMLGPSYETPAEVRMVGILGADAVGMSTVPEVIALARLGVPAVAFSMISNLGAGLSEGPLDHSEVREMAQHAGGQLARLIGGLLVRWG